jgi:hypothetical protein
MRAQRRQWWRGIAGAFGPAVPAQWLKARLARLR